MTPVSRRGFFAVVAASAVVAGCGSDSGGTRNGGPRAHTSISVENQLAGSRRWRAGAEGLRQADDSGQQIKGYASATSINVGGSINFHVSVAEEQAFSIEIYRLGHYQGHGARHILTSETLLGVRQPPPVLDPVYGTISCKWPAAWTLDVPIDWTPGLYLASFTTVDGWRSYAPFVVRDDGRSAAMCVIIPFTTYQAYNQWPMDNLTGKSLYVGYEPLPPGEEKPIRSYSLRAVKVSFDRPYHLDGMAPRLWNDHDSIKWIESLGYDVTYATSIDLHAGRVDPSKYAGLIFSGHDEYWSGAMRDTAERAVNLGTSLAFLMANNVYWHVRLEPSADGRPDRVLVCYKSDPDPTPDQYGATTLWREIGGDGQQAEQRLLGTQYIAIVADPVPLVVRAADHWFWDGTNVTDGDEIPQIVAGEADGVFGNHPLPVGVEQTILSASPFIKSADGKRAIHEASIYETKNGAIVFNAGTLNWPLGLSRPKFVDSRIKRATANLLDKISANRTRA